MFSFPESSRCLDHCLCFLFPRHISEKSSMDLFSLTARGPRKRVELRFKGDSLSQDFQVSEDTPNPVPSTSASASSSRESFTNSTTYLSDSNNNRVSVLSLNKTRNRLPALTVQAKNASRHDLVEIIDDALEQVFDPFQASQQVGVFEPEEVVKPSCSESASSVGRKPTGFLKLQAVHSNEEVVASSSAKRARSKGRSGSKKRERFRIETVASSTHASANPAATMATSDFTPSSVSRPVASNSAPASDVEPLDDEPMNDTQETPDTSSGITAESNAAAFQAHRPYPEAHVSSDESVASASTVDEEEEESLGDAATVLEELEQFAKDFRDLRIKRGYTQGHVSKLLAAINPNVSQSTVSRFESLCLRSTLGFRREQNYSRLGWYHLYF